MENTTRMDKYIFRTSSAVVVILALAAAILSYSALKQLAVQSGIEPMLSYLFPLVLDGLILSGTLLVLYFAVRGVRSKFGIFLTLLGVAASIAGNVAVSDHDIIHQMVHGAPALVLFLSLKALTILLRTKSNTEAEETLQQEAQNAPQKASEADTPPTTQSQPTKASESVNEQRQEPETVTTEPIHVPTPVEQEHPLPVPEKVRDAVQEIDKESNSHDSFIMDQYPVEETSIPTSYESKLEPSPEDVAESVPYTPLPETRPYHPVDAPASNKQPSTSFDWVQDEKPVSVPTKKTTPTETKKKVAQNSSSDEESALDYLGKEIPGETKKEKIEWILNKFPDAKPIDVVKVIGGDGSYIRKTIRDIRN